MCVCVCVCVCVFVCECVCVGAGVIYFQHLTGYPPPNNYNKCLQKGPFHQFSAESKCQKTNEKGILLPENFWYLKF